MSLKAYADLYREHLLDDVVPFWLKNSGDDQFGGYFTCLTREGKIYDTDKFIWLQCRQVWTFSMLYNQVAQKQEWLDFALQGASFLMKHGRDQEGNWYFSLSREGLPLVQPYNIFSDCFAAMAFSQLFKATGDENYRDLAAKTFYNILRRQEDPKGTYSKVFPGTRPMQSFSLPMILSNLVLEIEHVLNPALVESTIDKGINTVMEVFYQPSLGMVLETVAPDGSFLDTFEGRLINPGHGLEAMWFIMDLGERKGDQVLIRKAVDIALNTLEYGWDEEYGGIFYFKDVKGHPPQQLEWDQKLWWVHAEAMVCMLKGYMHTSDKRCLDWFRKLHQYTWDHFRDETYGEWYGYLNRQGEVLLSAKGGKWKGCFHVPRSLYQCWKTIEKISEVQPHPVAEPV